MSKILLLTQPECVPVLTPILQRARIPFEAIAERAQLERAMDDLNDRARLVSFAAKLIVPAALLARFAGPSYNFHPGPPAYPGLFPSVYALYDNCPQFGITLHEMAAQVDRGPIVAVEQFAIPAGCDRLALDTLTFPKMVEAFAKWLPQIAAAVTPLLHAGIVWSGRRRTRADFAAFCDLGENPTAEEFARRLRAAGEGPEHALTLTRFGRGFRLVSDAAGPIVRGGIAAK